MSQIFEATRWPDAEIEQVTLDYDMVTLDFTDESGCARTLRCDGYIAFRFDGLWDEMIVADATLEADGDLLRECLDDLSRRGQERDTGSPARNDRIWRQLTITLLDGARMRCVAASFEVVERG